LRCRRTWLHRNSFNHERFKFCIADPRFNALARKGGALSRDPPRNRQFGRKIRIEPAARERWTIFRHSRAWYARRWRAFNQENYVAWRVRKEAAVRSRLALLFKAR
jgi:hypothetical protein